MLLGLQRYDFFLKSSILFVCCDSKNTIVICYRLEALVAMMFISNILSPLLKKQATESTLSFCRPACLSIFSVSIFHCCRKFLSLSHHLLYLGNGWYALNEMLLRINLF